MSYEGEDRRAPNPVGWHLKKEIQLGHIITTVTVATSIMLFVSRIDSRVEMLEAQALSAKQAQHERDDRQDKANAEMIGLLRNQLERMETKLDRLVERYGVRP